MKALPKRKGNRVVEKLLDRVELRLNESPSEKEGKCRGVRGKLPV